MRTLIRYCLLQLPGTVLVGVILYVLWAADVIGTGLASALFGLVVLKDALLYPLYRPVLEKPLPPVGAQALVGERATARTDIAGQGLVHVRGELWQAHTGDGTLIPAGAPVTIVAARGLRLTVRRTHGEGGSGHARHGATSNNGHDRPQRPVRRIRLAHGDAVGRERRGDFVAEPRCMTKLERVAGAGPCG